jgi:hypothetical protein
MLMPEAAMDKERDTPGAEDQIRLAGKALDVKAIP